MGPGPGQQLGKEIQHSQDKNYVEFQDPAFRKEPPHHSWRDPVVWISDAEQKPSFWGGNSIPNKPRISQGLFQSLGFWVFCNKTRSRTSRGMTNKLCPGQNHIRGRVGLNSRYEMFLLRSQALANIGWQLSVAVVTVITVKLEIKG